MTNTVIERARIKDSQRMNVLPSIFGTMGNRKARMPAYSLGENNYYSQMDKHIQRANSNGYGYISMEHLFTTDTKTLHQNTAALYADSDERVTLLNPNNYCEVETTLRAASFAVWLHTLNIFAIEFYTHGHSEDRSKWNYQGDTIKDDSIRLFQILDDLKHFGAWSLNAKGKSLLNREESLAVLKFLD